MKYIRHRVILFKELIINILIYITKKDYDLDYSRRDKLCWSRWSWDFYDIRQVKRQKLENLNDDKFDNTNNKEKKQTESNINNFVIYKTS